MSDERTREMELTVKLTAARLDLKFVEAIGDLEKRIDKKLEGCQFKHAQSRMWSIRTWIQSIGTMIALCAALVALFRG